MPSNVRQTLSRCRRIRQHAEFERIIRADCLTNKWFAVYVKTNEAGIARLGVIASKRVMPKAVSRNFAKRLARDIFRKNFLATCALDVVIRVRRQLSPETSKEGRLALAQLLHAAQM